MGDVKIGVILFAMEVVSIGSGTLSKAAMTQGMSNYIFTTYTHAIALLFLIPCTFLYHRKSPPPPITWSMICRFFLLGVLNTGCNIFLYLGIRYSSPTLASAMNNLSPAYTFIIAIIFRMEILNLRAQSTLLKSIGTIVAVTGALIVTFYKGPPIIVVPSSHTNLTLHSLVDTNQPSWVVGAFLLVISSIFLSLAFVAKTWIARDYHSEVVITSISFVFEVIVAGIVTLIVENDMSVWTPSNQTVWISLLIGALEVAVVNTVNTWACRKKGPVFVAMFKPLQMIIAVLMGVSFLRDTLHLGSVIGGTTIAIGFYTVMKGKSEEEKPKEDAENRLIYSPEENTIPHKVPLLEDKNMNV